MQTSSQRSAYTRAPLAGFHRRRLIDFRTFGPDTNEPENASVRPGGGWCVGKVEFLGETEASYCGGTGWYRTSGWHRAYDTTKTTCHAARERRQDDRRPAAAAAAEATAASSSPRRVSFINLSTSSCSAASTPCHRPLAQIYDFHRSVWTSQRTQ